MNWQESSVLVTGGTGSFGRAFVEVMLRDCRPRRLVVFSLDELKQHEMRCGGLEHPSLRYFLGDVRDRERLRRAFDGVDVVVHAAALKQVPACEYNPSEAVRTNVDGAQNLVDAAIDCGVKKVLALSTDKAVNPVNLYGATKLCAEKLIVQGNSYSGGQHTRLSCTRYGNVLGSRGSVVSLFRRQRSAGKVTITDRRMTRFWLTLERAVRFVIDCIQEMHGGEVFVPRIPSMRITDLAEAIAPSCETEIIGIRPGEKLHETLVSREEARLTVRAGDKLVIQPAYPWWSTQNWCAGQPVAEDFEYTSDHNEDWLTVEQLRAIVGIDAQCR